jgi:hypothetical protein
MKTVLASLFKNGILIAALVISIFNLFYFWLSWNVLLAWQAFAGAAYLCASCFEYLNAGYKAALPIQRFKYFTNSYLMFKILKIALFLGFALLLLAAGNRVKFLSPLCLLIAASEIIILVLKLRNALCFVNIYANYLLIAQDKITKIFASEILIVEFRHNIFYFVKSNKKTLTIKLEHIANKENFVNQLTLWIKRNKIMLGSESDQEIQNLKSEFTL